jgi:DNA-binding MarR family transcriptional regulator
MAGHQVAFGNQLGVSLRSETKGAAVTSMSSTTSRPALDSAGSAAVDEAEAVLSALTGLIRTSRSIARRISEDVGASGTPVAVLKALARGDGHDRPGDLAVATGVAPSVVSRVLTRLEEDGLVSRRQDEADARSCRISLTERGVEHLARVQRQTAALLAPELAALDPEDRREIPRLLTLLEQVLAGAGDTAAASRHLHP